MSFTGFYAIFSSLVCAPPWNASIVELEVSQDHMHVVCSRNSWICGTRTRSFNCMSWLTYLLRLFMCCEVKTLVTWQGLYVNVGMAAGVSSSMGWRSWKIFLPSLREDSRVFNAKTSIPGIFIGMVWSSDIGQLDVSDHGVWISYGDFMRAKTQPMLI